MADLKYNGLKKVEIYILFVLSFDIQDVTHLSCAGLVHLSTPRLKSWRSCPLPEDGSSPFCTLTPSKTEEVQGVRLDLCEEVWNFALNSHSINHVLAF